MILAATALLLTASLHYGLAQSSTTTAVIIGAAGVGGSVSPTGIIDVSYGGSQTFTITPDSGYQIEGAEVNQTTLGPVTTYTVQNVTGETIFFAWFNSLTSPSPVSHFYAGGGYGIEDYPNPNNQLNLTNTPPPMTPAPTRTPMPLTAVHPQPTMSTAPSVPEFPTLITLTLLAIGAFSAFAVAAEKKRQTTRAR